MRHPGYESRYLRRLRAALIADLEPSEQCVTARMLSSVIPTGGSRRANFSAGWTPRKSVPSMLTVARRTGAVPVACTHTASSCGVLRARTRG